MLGLRFYACDVCDAVHAGPEEPPACSRCTGSAFRELTHDLQGDSYFWSELVAEPRETNERVDR